ncbi:tRNA (adenine(22)-N(1))-methyltransferase [Clostridium tarantellae]|uniref:SAM-dependent methyltransferase n=1 Tax=Clostridium tarantellae TaxID=39493 RepID=A0A6I1MFG4_9CLOT|nr:class I SAM-dependent methyltransferase [Clostridium tarantellae]MPQ42226.1 SAM-dependent methyltransferase [Clostridium tarantellae]
MELSLRLKIIANYVDNCESVADIGTDHGYIPIYLVKKGICEKAIASDINKGPIEKAKINVSFEGLTSKIQCRLGGGLKPLKNNEVNGVIIAGMGGNLTRDILIDDLEKIKLYDFIILQPAQNPEVLREYLYINKFEIINEDLIKDEDKYYELFKVKYNENKKPLLLENKINYEISPILMQQNHPMIKEYIKHKINRYENILNYIKEDTDSANNRKKYLNKTIGALKEMV